MKRAIIAALGLTLSITVATAAGDGKEKAKAKEKAKQEEKAARDKKRDTVNEILKAKDKNDDGALSLEEYLAGESDVEAATKNFEKFNKNKDRSLSKGEIAASVDT